MNTRTRKMYCASRSYLEVWPWKYGQRNCGVKCNFSKIRMEPVMLNFLAKTENLRNARSELPNYNRGKVVKKAAGKLLFAISRYKSNTTRAVLSWIGSKAIANKADTNKKSNRVNPQWKGGQLGYPNGPVPKLNYWVKTHFPCWNSLITNFLSLNLITLMLELLINVVTPILECAGIWVPNLVFLSVFCNCYVEIRRVLGWFIWNGSKFHCLIKSNHTDCSDSVFNGVLVFWVFWELSMGTFLFSRVGVFW